MKIETWADGFGVWRASVPLSGSASVDANKARKAIILALEERSERNFDPRSISVTRERVTNHGTAVYREVWR